MKEALMKFTLISDRVYLPGEGFVPAQLTIQNQAIVGVSKKLSAKADVDARGLWVWPGLIDPHTHIGIDEMEVGTGMGDTNEAGMPIAAELRASDGIFPRDPAIIDARNAGVTSAAVFPGSANIIGGLGVAVSLDGRTVDEMRLKEPVGLKMAFGENIRNVGQATKKGPVTRMGAAAMLRAILIKAQCYLEKLEKSATPPKGDKKKKATPPEPPERNLQLEAIAGLLKGEYIARIHAHRDDDMMTAVRIAEEFKFPYTIEHASSAHRIMDILASRRIHLTIGPTKSPRRKIECVDKTFDTVRQAWKAGVPFSITTDHPVITLDQLPVIGAQIVQAGVPDTVVLDAMTAGAADVLGIGGMTGRLKKGLLADLVISQAHPFEIAGQRIVGVFIRGQRVYSA